MKHTPALRLFTVACLLVVVAAALPVLAQPVAGATSAMPAAPHPTPASAGPTPSATAPRADVARLDYRLAARALAPGVWVVEGDNADFSVANGCNIINTGFIATGEGVLVINSGTSRLYGEQLRQLIARTTAEPVIGIVQLNLHPDYFLGHQAFADVPRWATAATRTGVAREAASYENNLYRLCGDWMKGTEAVQPDRTLDVAALGGRWRLGQREFELIELQGHTDSDLVLIDRTSGVVFAGGLVFAQRVPTTPHARIPAWQASLATLQQRLGQPAVAGGAAPSWLVPSHGPVQTAVGGLQAAQQTGRYLGWIDSHFSQWARAGWDMNEVLRAPVPPEFRQWAAFETEYLRNVAHLFPVYERQVMQAGRPAR